jgi:hypothetical protein
MYLPPSPSHQCTIGIRDVELNSFQLVSGSNFAQANIGPSESARRNSVHGSVNSNGGQHVVDANDDDDVPLLQEGLAQPTL